MMLVHRLQRLACDITPSTDAKSRIFSRITQRIGAPEALRMAAREMTPAPDLQDRVWERVARVVTRSPVAFFDRVRTALLPPVEMSRDIWQSFILPRLQPQHIAVRSYRGIAWATAVAMLIVTVRISPALFFAPPTRAESAVTLLPTRGEVMVSVGGLWQPVSVEIALAPGMRLKTLDSEASILFRNNGVLRMDRDTVITLNDLTQRMEPAPEILPTFMVEEGRVWVQAFIPETLRGITVALAEGHVTVNEGSVSITRGDLLTVEVYNRSAVLLREARETRLVAGDRIQLWAGSVPLIRHIAPVAYEDGWVSQNIDRDAVHRRDIAELQQERRVARAGILPTSKLYAMKRAAEAVDVALTFDGRTRVEKQIAYAGVRLDEAAALIEEGEVEAVAAPLEEYRRTLVALAGSSTDQSEAEFLLKQAVAEDSAETAAASMGDEGYLLKKTVLEALGSLPGEDATQAEASLLVDGLSTLAQAAEAGDSVQVTDAWGALQPYLTALEQHPDLAGTEEAKVLLERFARAVEGQEDLDPALLHAAIEFLPEEEPVVAVAHLSDEQVLAFAQGIKDNIFTQYRMPKSRSNVLLAELKKLQGGTDEGRILRALYHAMPEDTELRVPVRRAITQLKWSVVAGGEGDSL
ncbi:hypothetical protein A3G69_05800 [Candidatus Peribacteria bacterium RIFCSPLOWO2_12_FULL_53_10]|nr:MAG: hypothetical protein A3B61_00120 [Candidatus Peribacteria bacterium RIFCSPLOWO2_01_FULL_53_10]OGJ69817.1 MAG: hypothetical protein A3G69_05800 [Candidatus Peribacteria bacterium RIFCSPLOWO2_12_FULL_53_10]